jgi:CRISPR/Cas system-associated exonuclease Cas4 (RecB family)
VDIRSSRFRSLGPKHLAQMKAGLIPIHWLHSYGYCEYQLFLEKAVGIEAPPTAEMLAGSAEHRLLDEEHEKKAEIELTIDAAAEKAQTEEVSLVSRDVFVKGVALYGRIDEIVFEPNRIVIIDDKPSAKPYFNNKIQVWGYCQAFRQSYDVRLPLFGALRQEKSGDIVWLERFQKESDSLVDAAVRRIRAVLSGAAKPSTNVTVNRCRPCRFKESCPARMVD